MTALLSGATYHPFGPLFTGTLGNGQALYAWVDQAYRANWRYSGPYQQWINPFSNAYDGNGNLLSFTGSENPVFGYDALDRLTGATAPEFGSRDYAYDRNGNRSQRIADGQTTGYTYQPQSNRLATAGGQPVTLDANGNTTALRGMTLSYDARNRLIGVAGLGEYRYNGLGQRVVKTELVSGLGAQGHRRAFAYGLNGELLAETGPTGQVTREYIYLDGQPLAVLDRVPVSAEAFLRADFDGDGLIAGEDFLEWYFLHYANNPDPAYDVTGDGINDQADHDLMAGCAFGGQTCRASQYASRLYYVHNDHLGTPKALTDATGVKVWSATHDPFGLAAVDEDPDGDGVAVEFDLRFPGQYYDQETGLHYNYFRYYDPATGRYITADPIGLQGGLNTYLYVNANPLRGTDPRGLLPVMPWPTGDLPSPDYSPCSYYDQKCTETGCRYYCTTAPAICRNAERLPLFWGINNRKLNCIRRCLVREDKKIHDRRTQCTDNDCLSDQEIDNYHNRCFTECGVSPSRYPGVNPPWFPGNPNAPNRPN